MRTFARLGRPRRRRPDPMPGPGFSHLAMPSRTLRSSSGKSSVPLRPKILTAAAARSVGFWIAAIRSAIRRNCSSGSKRPSWSAVMPIPARASWPCFPPLAASVMFTCIFLMPEANSSIGTSLRRAAYPREDMASTLVPAFSARSAIADPPVAAILAAVSSPANIPAGEEAKLAMAASGPGSSPPRELAPILPRRRRPAAELRLQGRQSLRNAILLEEDLDVGRTRSNCTSSRHRDWRLRAR